MKMKRLLLAICVLVLALIPTPAYADIAPPAQPPGSNLQPGVETTQVRMVAETVLIDVSAGTSSKSLGQAHVTADFTMRNLGDTAESMAVRFPVGANDGWFTVKEISGFRVKVAGKQVPTHRIQGEDPSRRGSEQVPWASFDVTFPPGQDVPVRVEYNLEASGEYPFAFFDYILSTGAGWKDTIGSADIIVRLPYDLNDENLLLDSPGVIMFGATPGGTIEGNIIRWHYDNLEPTTQDNFEVNLVTPSAWQSFLTEQENVRRNPADGEAWGRLGKVCKEMAYSSRGKGFRGGNMDPGAEKLYEQSVAAYEKAVTLLPKDALWHAGYADLLSYHAYFAAFAGTDTTQESLHALREIQTALSLAPNDAKVQQIAEQVSWSVPDGMKQNGKTYDYPWLTATPMPKVPTPAPTREVAQAVPTDPAVAQDVTPTAETVATRLPAATPAAPAKPSLPICGGALLLPLAFVAGAWAHHGGRKTER
jgi:hypothetical protein